GSRLGRQVLVRVYRGVDLTGAQCALDHVGKGVGRQLRRGNVEHHVARRLVLAHFDVESRMRSGKEAGNDRRLSQSELGLPRSNDETSCHHTAIGLAIRADSDGRRSVVAVDRAASRSLSIASSSPMIRSTTGTTARRSACAATTYGPRSSMPISFAPATLRTLTSTLRGNE